MDDKREFKIDLHAGDPDDAVSAAGAIGEDMRQSNKTLTLLLAFAFIAFGGMVAFFYYNLNNKIQTINTRGSAGITSLSNEFNDKLTEFSEQFSSQHEVTRILVSELDALLKKLNSSVASIQKEKPDKKELTEAIAGIQEDLAPLQESIKSFNEQFTGVQNEINRMASNLKNVETGVLNNKKEISTLDAIHIDREYFDQELKKEREFNQQNMAHASEALFSEIAALHQRIKELEEKIARQSISPTGQQKSLNNSPAKTKSPSDSLSVPKPGEIIEQEIK